MKNELKPCPFCGSKPSYDNFHNIVSCCGAVNPMSYDRWQSRPAPVEAGEVGLTERNVIYSKLPEDKRGMVDENHCKDCCCARSWKALGVSEYTGKSIVEHIEELKKILRIIYSQDSAPTGDPPQGLVRLDKNKLQEVMSKFPHKSQYFETEVETIYKKFGVPPAAQGKAIVWPQKELCHLHPGNSNHTCQLCLGCAIVNMKIAECKSAVEESQRGG